MKSVKIKGHWRIGKDGKKTWVKGHTRQVKTNLGVHKESRVERVVAHGSAASALKYNKRQRKDTIKLMTLSGAKRKKEGKSYLSAQKRAMDKSLTLSRGNKKRRRLAKFRFGKVSKGLSKTIHAPLPF